MNQIVVNPIDRSHHDGEGGFREQIFAMYYTGIWTNPLGVEWAKFIKTLFHVCKPGSASMDPINPGADTGAAWEAMDELIENESVRGFYHTHPAGADWFSRQDMLLIRGFAQSNGELPLWHVIQAADSAEVQAICSNMVNGNVFVYRLGGFAHDPDDPILLLPLPPKVESKEGMSIIDLRG